MQNYSFTGLGKVKRYFIWQQNSLEQFRNQYHFKVTWNTAVYQILTVETETVKPVPFQNMQRAIVSSMTKICYKTGNNISVR